MEIFTEKDGEVIFKKYSPMGELGEFATQICNSLGRNTGRIAAVSDRDSIIALSGAPKLDLMDKQNSRELEQIMEQRKPYRYDRRKQRPQRTLGFGYRCGNNTAYRKSHDKQSEHRFAKIRFFLLFHCYFLFARKPVTRADLRFKIL